MKATTNASETLKTTATTTIFFVIVSLWFVPCVRGQQIISVRISNASDLINFSKEVNKGTYNDSSKNVASVILENDIDFSEELSEQFEPIGKDSTHFFWLAVLSTGKAT